MLCAVAPAWRSIAKHCLCEVEAAWRVLLLHPRVPFDHLVWSQLPACTSTVFTCRVVGTLHRHIFLLQHLGQLFGKPGFIILREIVGFFPLGLAKQGPLHLEMPG